MAYNPEPIVTIGPNGTIEIKQMNGVQGWHSGYVDPKTARQLAIRLVTLADAVEQATNKTVIL